MNFFNLALKNIRNNFKSYITYLISTTFAVMIFDIFSSLYYNKQFVEMGREISSLQAAFKTSGIMIIIFSVVFIWYSSSFFIRNRKKEIATYSLLGTTKRQIARMLFYENLAMGMVALILGILLGTMLSKLFAMIFIYVVGEAVDIRFVVETKAIIETALVFFILFLINALHGYSIIYRFKLVELFRAEKEGEKFPKTSVVLTIFSIILIGLGYAIALKSGGGIVITSIPILIIVVTGTYILFNNFVVILIKNTRKNKNYYYNGVNIISISQLLYRIKGNARTLATIAVLGAVTITSIGTTFAFYMATGKLTSAMNPYSISYVDKGEAVNKKVEDIINKNSEVKLASKDKLKFIKTQFTFMQNKKLRKEDGYLISESQYKKAAAHQGKSNIRSLNNDKEVLVTFYNVKDKENISIKTGSKAAVLSISGSSIENLVHPNLVPYIAVVSDKVYNDFYKENTEVVAVNGYMLDEPKKSKNVIESLRKELPKDFKIMSFYEEYSATMKLSGVLVYIGAFIGILFMLSTGSIIYYKQLVEANDDKERYVILKNIGISKEEIREAIARQMRVVFGLPLLISICHSAVALKALENMLLTNIFIYCAMVMTVYIIVYIIYYYVTVNSYTKIIES